MSDSWQSNAGGGGGRNEESHQGFNNILTALFKIPAQTHIGQAIVDLVK